MISVVNNANNNNNIVNGQSGNSLVSVKSEIMKQMKILCEFYKNQKDLVNVSSQISSLTQESFLELQQLLEQTSYIMISKKYECLSVPIKIQLYSRLRDWVIKADYLCRVQMGSILGYVPEILDAKQYEQLFLKSKKDEGLQNQKQRLAYKLFLKQKKSQKQNVSKPKRVLPEVPEFSEDIAEEMSINQDDVFSFQEFAYVPTDSVSFDDSISTNSTTDNQSVSFKSINSVKKFNPIQIVSNVSQSQDSSCNSPSKYQSKRFSKLEESIMSIIEQLNLSQFSSSALLADSLKISAEISKDNQFFKNKSLSAISAAIILLSAEQSSRAISIKSISNLLSIKERQISKVQSQLSSALNISSSQVSPSSLIMSISSQLQLSEQIIQASNYLYKNMEINGLLQADPIQEVVAAIIFLSNKLNHIDIDAKKFSFLCNVSCEQLLVISNQILKNGQVLFNNPSLFSAVF